MAGGVGGVDRLVIELGDQPFVNDMARVALLRVLQVTWIRVVRRLPVAVQAVVLKKPVPNLIWFRIRMCRTQWGKS